MDFPQAATMAKAADRDMAIITGMPHLSNQIQIPPAPIPPIHYNNQTVNVTGGMVGAINFGNVHEIQVSLQALTQNGEPGISDAMLAFTQAILDSNEIAEAHKGEMLEQVAFLTSQASASTAERKPGMIKTVFGAVKDGASAVGGIATAWAAVEPLLAGRFGL